MRGLRVNRIQKDGLARVFDGFTIASGISVYSYLGGHAFMTGSDVFTTFLVGILCVVLAFLLRKDVT